MSAVGRGEMKAADVVRAMYPDYKDERVTGAAPQGEGGWFGLNRAKAVKFKVPEGAETKAAIPIRGINTDLPVRFAPNGGAVPGDRIVGIMTPGEGITIYPIQSPALKEFEDQPERWLDVRWDVDEKMPQRFPARLALQSVNEPGSLVWNELMSRDVPASRAFYHQVLGLDGRDSSLTGGYTELTVSERSVGGIMDISGSEWPACIRSR